MKLLSYSGSAVLQSAVSKSPVLKNHSPKNRNTQKTAVLKNRSTQKPQYSKSAELKNRSS